MTSTGTDAKLASRSRRLLGYIVDFVVWGVLWLAILRPRTQDGAGALARDVSYLVLLSAYHVVGVRVWGRTLGKLVARTRVIDLRTGRSPDWRRSMLRWLPQLVARLTVGSVSGLGSVVSAVVYVGVVSSRRQGLHDRLAGSSVADA